MSLECLLCILGGIIVVQGLVIIWLAVLFVEERKRYFKLKRTAEQAGWTDG